MQNPIGLQFCAVVITYNVDNSGQIAAVVAATVLVINCSKDYGAFSEEGCGAATGCHCSGHRCVAYQGCGRNRGVMAQFKGTVCIWNNAPYCCQISAKMVPWRIVVADILTTAVAIL